MTDNNQAIALSKKVLAKLPGRITPEMLHQVLSYPVWNLVQETINYTRSYEIGLEKGFELLKIAERYKGEFSKDEHRNHITSIYMFILNTLDKLDMWEDYLVLWEKLAKNINHRITYPKYGRKSHGKAIETYILKEDSQNIYAHILYTICHRKEIIERKLARKRSGKSVKHLLHARQDNLSEDEIKRRYHWILKKAEYVSKLDSYWKARR